MIASIGWKTAKGSGHEDNKKVLSIIELDTSVEKKLQTSYLII